MNKRALVIDDTLDKQSHVAGGGGATREHPVSGNYQNVFTQMHTQNARPDADAEQ